MKFKSELQKLRGYCHCGKEISVEKKISNQKELDKAEEELGNKIQDCDHKEGNLINDDKTKCFRCNHLYDHYFELKDTLSKNRIIICDVCGKEMMKFLKTKVRRYGKSKKK